MIDFVISVWIYHREKKHGENMSMLVERINRNKQFPVVVFIWDARGHVFPSPL